MANSYLNQDDDYLDGAQPKKKKSEMFIRLQLEL